MTVLAIVVNFANRPNGSQPTSLTLTVLAHQNYITSLVVMTLSERVSGVCSALSHPKRVDIFLALLSRVENGVPYGELSEILDMPASTLSFHLKEMEKGGVVARAVVGRHTYIRPSMEKLNGVLNELSVLCCPDGPENLNKDR